MEQADSNPDWNEFVNKKHVLIMTADAGLGHRQAAEAIEAALNELYDEACQVRVTNPIIEADTPKILERLERDYDQHVTKQPGLYQLAYHAIDAPVVSGVAQQLAALLLQDTMLQIVRNNQFDALISTHLTHSHAAAAALRQEKPKALLAVAVTDLIDVQRLWFNQDATMHFVATEPVRQQALENKIPPDHVMVTGVPIEPEFAFEKRSKEELRRHLGWQPEVPTALIVASHRTQQMASVSQMLDRSEINLQLVLVAGGDQQLYERLENIEWRGIVQLYNWVEDMPPLMKASDFIITKAGGLILSEALACGLPVILSEALPGQEVGNARFIVENDAGAWAPGAGEVLATVHSWLKGDRSHFEQLQNNARRLGNPRAALDIAERLWELI